MGNAKRIARRIVSGEPDGIPYRIHPSWAPDSPDEPGAVNIRSPSRPGRSGSVRPAFGRSDGRSDGTSYAVKVDSLSSNDFLSQPFGRQLDDMKKLRAWKETASKAHAGAKGKSTMPAVRRWVRENKPAEFYARWKSDGPMWKDDSVEIYYK